MTDSRTAVVTGSESGIGLATVQKFRSRSVTVIGVDRSAGADIQLDISDGAAVRNALAGVRADILVNVAGIGSRETPLLETTDDEWIDNYAVNVLGMVHMCQALVPGMVERGWGRVVNMSSISGKEGNPNMSVYSANKAAVIALTKSLGKELARTGVLVNVVAPAMIDTPMSKETTPELKAVFAEKIPLGRLGDVDEAANLLVWLASDEMSFSTGAVFDLSGGRATY